MSYSLYLQHTKSKSFESIWINQKKFSRSEKFTCFSCLRLNNNVQISYIISFFQKMLIRFVMAVTELLTQLFMAVTESISAITF